MKATVFCFISQDLTFILMGYVLINLIRDLKKKVLQVENELNSTIPYGVTL